MQDLSSLLILAVAFGGFGVVGVIILIAGLFAAQRTSSVIACAAAAAILFALQLGWIYFWHSFGVGFGGEGRRSAAILQWGSTTAVVLVGGFLALKLPRAVGKVVESARWWRDGAKVSALITVAYVLYLVGGVFLRWAYPPGGGVPSIAPVTWLTALAGAVLAWGLWQHRGWAWYAAVAGAAFLAIRTVWFVSQGRADFVFLFMSTPTGVRLLLLVALLGVLLFSNARRLCVAQS